MKGIGDWEGRGRREMTGVTGTGEKGEWSVEVKFWFRLHCC